MSFEMIDSILNINLDNVGTLTVAALLFLLGYFLRKRINFLEKFCIPAPVIGGLIFALINFVFWQTNIIHINFDVTFQDPMMIAFFTTIGIGASFALLKKGGKLLIVYWLLCGALGILQNSIGVVLAKFTGIAPMFGLMAGAISLEGGHGGAASFGQTAEIMGYEGAVVVGMAAATFGLVAGGLLGGPVTKRLIDKYNLKPDEVEEACSQELESEKKFDVDYLTIIKHITLITVCMTIGSLVGKKVSGLLDIILPSYVSAMFVAVIVRNVNNKFKFMNIDMKVIEKIGDVCLGLFLSMALMSLKLWQLADLAGPMIIILTCQIVVIFLFVNFITFRLLGKTYDAAVMSAGMLGHGLGATPNAIANMGAVTEKYGYSRKAFLIVPVVGAFLVDLINIPAIVWFMNYFG